MNFTGYSCGFPVLFLNREFYRYLRYGITPVIFTGGLQGLSDSQGYPVNFTGKRFAVHASAQSSATVRLNLAGKACFEPIQY